MTKAIEEGKTRKSEKSGIFTIVLSLVYALLLVGIVLFKLPFSLYGIESVRVVNLVPFMGSFTEDGVFTALEVIENVLAFVPFGIYISMLKDDWSFVRKLIPLVSTTLAFEVIQFIFAIGRSDITDLLGNTLGGILGIGLYALLAKLLKKRTDVVINLVALFLFAGVTAFLTLMLLRIPLPF
jgi:glycopeptide antibiotics resistance protein